MFSRHQEWNERIDSLLCVRLVLQMCWGGVIKSVWAHNAHLYIFNNDKKRLSRMTTPYRRSISRHNNNIFFNGQRQREYYGNGCVASEWESLDYEKYILTTVTYHGIWSCHNNNNNKNRNKHTKNKTKQTKTHEIRLARKIDCARSYRSVCLWFLAIHECVLMFYFEWKTKKCICVTVHDTKKLTNEEECLFSIYLGRFLILRRRSSISL